MAFKYLLCLSIVVSLCIQIALADEAADACPLNAHSHHSEYHNDNHEILHEFTSRQVKKSVFEYAQHLQQQRTATLRETCGEGFSNELSVRPPLRFRPDGTFKIAIFTDLHYGEGEASKSNGF